MGELDPVLSVINTHANELKKPGVISICPGYKLANGWPTTQPAIVVVVSRGAGPVTLPPAIEGVPIEVRTASDVEQLKFDDPNKYNAIAQQRSEFRGGAFDEVDPVIGAEALVTEGPTRGTRARCAQEGAN